MSTDIKGDTIKNQTKKVETMEENLQTEQVSELDEEQLALVSGGSLSILDFKYSLLGQKPLKDITDDMNKGLKNHQSERANRLATDAKNNIEKNAAKIKKGETTPFDAIVANWKYKVTR